MNEAEGKCVKKQGSVPVLHKRVDFAGLCQKYHNIHVT